MTVRPSLRFWLLFGISLAVVVIWVFVKTPPGRRTATLPDGRQVTLLAATFGTQHRFVVGKPWLRPLAPVLPDAWLKKLGMQVFSYTSPTPTLRVWASVRGGKGALFPLEDASVGDGHGLETEPIRRLLAAYPSGLGTIMGWEFTHFPRRDKTIRVGIYLRDNGSRPHRAAQFTVDNPARRSYPVWTAQPPPLTRKEGDLEFALLNLTAGETVPEKLKPARGFVAPWSTAVFRVSQAGQPVDEWRVAGLELADATGNSFAPRATTFTQVGDYLLFGFGAAFWPGESAWKLRAEFSRAAGFSSNELILVRSVAVPPTNGQTQINFQAVVNGITLRVNELSRTLPGGTATIGGRRWNAEVLATAIPPTPGVHLDLVSVADDQGRLIHRERNYSDPTGRHSFLLLIPPDAATLDFTFALPQSRFAEFLVPAPHP